MTYSVAGDPARSQRIAQQQAVLNKLRSGQPIKGAKSANPILGLIQNLTGVSANIPDLYGAKLGGEDVLVARGGWNQRAAGAGPVNLGGATWFPAQSGSDLIYKRGEGAKPGPYGEVFSASDGGGGGGGGGGLDLNRPKPFAMTSEGQFERYFKTPEMDQYFGAASRDKGAPADAAAMDKLASGKGVPEGTGIATKYRAESAMGRGNMDEIVEAMGYKGSPMETWARANPMLAFREYNKKFPAGEPTIGPTPAALQASEGPMTAFGQEVKTFFPGAEPGADADVGRLEGEELIDAYNMMRSREASSKEPVSKRVGAFLGQYGDLGALTK